MAQEIKAQQEVDGCTFAPVMYTKKKKQSEQQEPRDVNKFLEDQKKYLEMKKIKED